MTKLEWHAVSAEQTVKALGSSPTGLGGEEAEKRITKMASRLHETLEKLKNQLPSEEQETLTEMKRLLEDRQIERFSQSFKNLIGSFL